MKVLVMMTRNTGKKKLNVFFFHLQVRSYQINNYSLEILFKYNKLCPVNGLFIQPSNQRSIIDKDRCCMFLRMVPLYIIFTLPGNDNLTQ